MHTALVDMFLLFAYHFRALEGRSSTVVNMSSVRGAVLYYSGGVRFFWNENVQEYCSYVVARCGWRNGADHELESRPVGLMRYGHSFLLCPASFPLGQSNHTQCSAAAPGPLIRPYVLMCCACVACTHPSWCWCVQLQTCSAAFEFETAQPSELALAATCMH